MALTRITKGVIKPNENYDTHNINSTGIVTAIGLDVNGNGDISGNLNVGGILTYEDVTSIDSVGLITARAGINVTDGNVTIAKDLDVDGHTELDNLNVSGIGTFNGIRLIDNKSILLGTSDDMRIRHTGSHSQITDEGTGSLRLGGNQIVIGIADFTETSAVFTQGAGVTLKYANNTKFATTNTGVSITGNNVVSGNVTAVDGTFSGNVSIAGVTTTTGNIHLNSTDKKIYLTSDYDQYITANAASNYMAFAAGNQERLRIKSDGKVVIGDTNTTAQLGVVRDSYYLAEFTNTNADATGAELSLRKDSASPADNDSLGLLNFIGDNDAGQKTTYAYIRSKSTDVSDGTEDGTLEFHTRGNGTISERLRINSTGAIQITPEGSTGNPYMLIDTSGDSVRFSAKKSSGNNTFRFLTQSSGSVNERLRITSDGKVKICHVDGTNPTEPLHVVATAVNQDIARFTGANKDRGLVISTSVSGSTNDAVINYNADSQNSVGQHVFKTDGNERLRIRSDGAMATKRSAGASLELLRNTATTGTTDVLGQLIFGSSDWDSNVASIISYQDGAKDKGALTFHTQAAIGPGTQERLRITSDGKIHTGSPASFATDDFNITSLGTGAKLSLCRASTGNASDGDLLGAISFQSYPAGQAFTGAEAAIRAYAETGQSGSAAPSSLHFYTKPSTIGPGGSGSERLRITSGGQLIHNAGNASGHVAEFNQTNTSNDARILINSPADNNIRPAFIQLSNAGTAKWGVGQVYASTSSGAFHLLAGNNQESNSKFVVTTAGRVGIGTINPGAVLSVLGSTAELRLQHAGNSSYSRIISDASNQLNFYTGGGPHLAMAIGDDRTVTFKGNVLINNTSGVSLLQLNDNNNNALHELGTPGNGDFRITVDKNDVASSQEFQLYMRGSDAADLAFHIDHDKNVTIPNGKLGIGDDNPYHTLQVQGANDTTFDNLSLLGLAGTDAYNSGNAGSGINFNGKYNNSGNFTTLAQISGIKENTTDGNYDGALTFGTRNTAQGTNIERVRITSDGKLLIGRTSESHSSSTVEIQGGNETYLRIASNTNTGTSAIIFGTADDHSTGGIYYQGSDDALVFAGYNNDERLRIASDGHIYPAADNTQDLGSDSKTWRKFYIQNMYPEHGTQQSTSGSSFSSSSWYDVGYERGNMGGLDLNGVYIITLFADTWAAGGGNYSCNYTWIMGMRNQSTNQNTSNSIPLLSVTGHSTNNNLFELRTTRQGAVYGGNEWLQWRCTANLSEINGSSSGRIMRWRVQRIGRSSTS